MRVVFISYMHPKVAPGGAQQVAYELFQASLKEGHDAYLICTLEENHIEAYGKPGAPIVPLHGEERQYLFFPQFYDFLHLSIADWRAIGFFRKLLEQLGPDVVHFHHYHRIGVETIRAARLAAPRAVISMTFHEMMAMCLANGQMITTKTRQLCQEATPMACHGCFQTLRPEFFTLRASRLKAMFRECDVFVFPSEFLANRYVDWGLPIEKCVVIPNGQVDLSSGSNRQAHSELLNRFGFFGQFIDNKGVDLIFRALLILARERRVPARGIVLEVNGSNQHYASSSYIEEVSKLVEDLRAESSAGIEVVDRGAYTRNQLSERMSSVDWVVVPSTWWEVFGLVVSEAWMFGRPVIAADVGGLRERIRQDIDGVLFPIRDARALADVITLVVGDSDRWLRLHRSLSRPWSEIQMLNAHQEVWAVHRNSREA